MSDNNEFDTSGGPSQDKPRDESSAKKVNKNEIVVTVADPAPVLILFGPKSSGKTMALKRLIRYLQSGNMRNKYSVVADPNFRPSDDSEYKKSCETFMSNVHSDQAELGTGNVDFMLIKVRNNRGKTIFQILEAPGEDYFDPGYPEEPYPDYINRIITGLSNRRTWVFFIEKDWLNERDRSNYAERISQLAPLMKRNDKVIVNCVKADEHNELLYEGLAVKNRFFQEMRNQYPGIFSTFRNNNPLTRFYRPHDFEFNAFSAGKFSKNPGAKMPTYAPSDENYPREFLRIIMKTVKGGWWS
jgi:hypothetical protein